MLDSHQGPKPDHEAHETARKHEFEDCTDRRAPVHNQIFSIESFEMSTKLGHCVPMLFCFDIYYPNLNAIIL